MLSALFSVLLDIQHIPAHVWSLPFASQSLKRLHDATYGAQNQGHLATQTAADIIPGMVTRGAPQTFIEVGSKIIIIRNGSPVENLTPVEPAHEYYYSSQNEWGIDHFGFCITTTSELLRQVARQGFCPSRRTAGRHER